MAFWCLEFLCHALTLLEARDCSDMGLHVTCIGRKYNSAQNHPTSSLSTEPFAALPPVSLLLCPVKLLVRPCAPRALTRVQENNGDLHNISCYVGDVTADFANLPGRSYLNVPGLRYDCAKVRLPHANRCKTVRSLGIKRHASTETSH